jgi:hypothetical protein
MKHGPSMMTLVINAYDLRKSVSISSFTDTKSHFPLPFKRSLLYSLVAL